MNGKSEFWILNIVGGICAVLIIAVVIVTRSNTQMTREVSQTQNQFGQAQQLQETARNLIMRIADAGQREAALNQLLVRHNFQVNTGANASAKPAP